VTGESNLEHERNFSNGRKPERCVGQWFVCGKSVLEYNLNVRDRKKLDNNTGNILSCPPIYNENYLPTSVSGKSGVSFPFYDKKTDETDRNLMSKVEDFEVKYRSNLSVLEQKCPLINWKLIFEHSCSRSDLSELKYPDYRDLLCKEHPTVQWNYFFGDPDDAEAIWNTMDNKIKVEEQRRNLCNSVPLNCEVNCPNSETSQLLDRLSPLTSTSSEAGSDSSSNEYDMGKVSQIPASEDCEYLDLAFLEVLLNDNALDFPTDMPPAENQFQHAAQGGEQPLLQDLVSEILFLIFTEWPEDTEAILLLDNRSRLEILTERLTVSSIIGKRFFSF
jgi:hypothetical protein